MPRKVSNGNKNIDNRIGNISRNSVGHTKEGPQEKEKFKEEKFIL